MLTSFKENTTCQVYLNLYLVKNYYLIDFLSLKELKKKNIIYGLIKEMISADPKQRPKLDEVLTRPIFNVTTSTSEELLKDDT